jgi:anti-anti-sigma factor
MTGSDQPVDDLSGPSQELTIRSRQADCGVVCEVAGEVDLVTVQQFQTGLREALQDKPNVLVVNLDGLTFLGSHGLSVLVETNNIAGPGVMRIVVGNREPRRAIEMMGLDQVLTICATVDKALSVDTEGSLDR